MTERAGLIKRYFDNFVLDEAKLRRIAAIMQEFSDKLSKETYLLYYVERADDSFYETRELNDVFSDDNSSEKAITQLSVNIEEELSESKIKKEKSTDKPMAVINFSRQKPERIIIGVSEQDRGWCFLLADELETQVQRLLKKTYWRFLRKKTVDLAFGIILLIAFFVCFIWIALRVPPVLSTEQIQAMTPEEQIGQILRLLVKREAPTSVWLLPSFLSLFLIPLMLVDYIRPISRIVTKIDRSVFYWGDAKEEYDRHVAFLGKLKWTVAIGFVVSVLAGWASGLLFA